MKRKPRIAVFFGGSATNHDLSRATGYAVCHYLPRGTYDAVPVQVMPDGRWQVPLGTLPSQGPVDRILDQLWQTIPAVSARDGLERLMAHEPAAWITVLRGKGGDDGSLQTLASTFDIPMVGSPAAACHHTAHKYTCQRLVADMVPSPRAELFTATTPTDDIVSRARESFLVPFFVKSATEEGSMGVEEVHQIETFIPTLRQYQANGVILQERVEGREVALSILNDGTGSSQILPPTTVHLKRSTFYDSFSKRHAGRVQLTADELHGDTALQTAAMLARAAFDRLGCEGIATFDFILRNHEVYLLEVNTAMTLTPTTPLWHQLQASHLHPTQFLDRLVRQRVG
jgi:D-alanine-D-alanine ligase